MIEKLKYVDGVTINIKMGSNKKTVLVVDDDRATLGSIQALLEKEGYNVVASSSGREALEFVDAYSVDLMLLDVMMPVLEGGDVLKMVRGSAKKPFPIIYVTVRPKEGLDLKGSDGYIQKPFNNKEFIDYIKNVLQKWSKKEK